MRWFCAILLLPCLLFSCTRGKEAVSIPQGEAAARPLAVLQAGKYPLWFQFTDDGPVLIETIEDACFSAAFIPWPLTRHIRFILARDGEIMMAVNRDGFICLSPWQGGIGLYRLSGGEYWQSYTVGAFFLSGEERKPLALLYRDDRFVDSDQPVPQARLWTFDLQAAAPYTMAMPALDAFAPEEGWNIDALRRGPDAYWYFRASRKTAARPEILMLRAGGFTMPGEKVSLGAFQNSAMPEPVSAAPQALGKMLGIAFAESGHSAALVVSPDFQYARSFAANPESGAPDNGAIAGFYSGAFFLAASANGEAFYIEAGAASARRFSLPALPEGFVYTGICMIAGTVFASWEEQEGYSIGAAGFMVVKFDSSIGQ
ncbi:MAG: hypothetical protein LBU85_03925 [Treponema sp.]|jgi:hypothetical protein|nr:hypothetical protein [Treponema sp.]